MLLRNEPRHMARTIRSSGYEELCQAFICVKKKRWADPRRCGRALHFHQAFVARVESHRRRIDVMELIVLAGALGVDAGETLRMVKGQVPEAHRV